MTVRFSEVSSGPARDEGPLPREEPSPLKFVPPSPSSETAETEPCVSSVRSTNSSCSGSRIISGSRHLRANLTRERKNCDPLQSYEVLKILGVGSMGTVAKVRKKLGSIGGSARKSNVGTREESPCFSLPLVGGIFRHCVAIGRAAAQHQYLSIRSSMSNHSEFSANEMIFAMKSIHLSRMRDIAFVEELKNEIEILKTLDHPHVVRAIETFEHRNQLFVVMECCSGSDLYSRDPYTEDEAARITSSVLSAVGYMHAKGIAHRDIKYENILFASNSPQAEVKLIDFGLSRKFFHPDEEMTVGVGTIYTMAPEVLRQKYTKAADLWSIGVVAYMLLSSQMPFYGRERSHVVEKILVGKYKFRGQRWRRVSQQAKDFVSDLLVVNPEERADAEEAMASTWLNRRHSATLRNPLAEEISSANESLLRFANYSKLRKVALMVVAHKSTSAEIGILRKVFQSYDTNGSGALDYDEFKAAISEVGFKESDYHKVFDAVDMDGSGQIRYTEFLAATIETFGSIGEERLAEAFDRLDSDDSGYITTENLAELLGTEFPKKEIDEIVREADIYRDGRISYPEFLALWEDYHEQDRFDLLSEITMESSDDSDKRNVLAARAGFVERRIASERGLPPQNVTITSFVS